MGSRDLGALVLLSSLWGGSFLFLRVAAPSLGPVVLIEVRVLLAGLVLLGYATALGRVPRAGRHWPDYLFIGAINSAVPFVLISWAELRLPASLAATLNATTPLFGALVASVWLRESLTGKRAAGLAVGFAGVAVLAGLGPLPLTPGLLLSVGASLAAALCYGVAAVYTKVRVPGGDPRTLSLYSQLFAAGVLAPFVPFAIPAALPTATVVVCVLALAVLSTALAYLLYFRLVANVGPTKALLVTYLVPAFGALWGALFLGETLGWSFFGGFALIAVSVTLVSGAPAARKAVDRA